MKSVNNIFSLSQHTFYLDQKVEKKTGPSSGPVCLCYKTWLPGWFLSLRPILTLPEKTKVFFLDFSFCTQFLSCWNIQSVWNFHNNWVFQTWNILETKFWIGFSIAKRREGSYSQTLNIKILLKLSRKSKLWKIFIMALPKLWAYASKFEFCK